MVDFDEIYEIYKKVEGRLTQDEFMQKVEEKFSMLNGLCDYRTAALLVASEMGEDVTTKIKDMVEGNVTFIAKVLHISDIREFYRDDNSVGRVVNLTLADDTGIIRAALWDEAADLVKIGDIKTGQSLKIKGYIKAGKRGLEVNVSKSGNIEHVDKEVHVCLTPLKISELRPEMNNLNVVGKVLDTGSIRTFQRKDGSMGKIRRISIGDETGKIDVVLWGSEAEDIGFEKGDTVEIMNAFTRENAYTNQTEIHIGRGSIIKSDAVVEYSEKFTQIADIVMNSTCSVKGYVSGMDVIREFERQDGTKGKVSSIYVSDDTGRIKVVLWGEHAELVNELDIGSEVCVIDAYAKPGMNGEIELSTGARSSVEILKK